MLKKYYPHIIIAIILISVIWTIAFYFHYYNKEQTMQKTLDGTLNKEPQREFYVITPGPQYLNKKYKFSMIIPNDKFILEENFSNSDGDSILLIDETSKENFKDILIESNPGVGGVVYFDLFVSTKSGESVPSLKENINNLEQMSQKGIVEKTEFLISGNKKVSFYLTSDKNEVWPASLDMFLPEATAFFEDGSNIYYFLSSSYYNDSIEERQSHINIMEKAIKSIKFSN
ncbi:MAG: hypothetical protein PHY72_04405 [Candidatus Pacebacteria bacterium]|nr:hypothetical protein [Candidatus Paceibacterota bacterium]